LAVFFQTANAPRGYLHYRPADQADFGDFAEGDGLGERHRSNDACSNGSKDG
jgi:hypothetical protein